jgi:hypothetical protein
MLTVKEVVKLGVKVTLDNPHVVALAEALKMEPKDVAMVINQEIYRAQYNSKPEVKLARKAYNAERMQLLKKVRTALKANPNLLDGE